MATSNRPDSHPRNGDVDDVSGAALPVLPLNTGVVGPNMVVTLALDSPEARAAADDAAATDGKLLLVPRVDGRYATVGTLAKVEQDGGLRGGSRGLVVRGVDRVVLGTGRTDLGEALWIDFDRVGTSVVSSSALDALVLEYKVVVEAILGHRGASRLAEATNDLDDPNAVADLALYSPDLSFEQKVTVLETTDVEARLRLVLGWAKDVLADLEVRGEIRRNVENELGEAQREASLRRQLQAIRAELDDEPEPADDYRAKLAQLIKADVDTKITDQIDKEITKLERGSAQSPEQGWTTAWLDTVFEIPWTNRVTERLDLADAAAQLDADHAGLDKVKERVLELLAVRKLTAQRSTGGRPTPAILLLVGPPGVGKTSLGESIARTLGRPFGRVSLGGVRDEAEIRGHRRTYVGARAGRIVTALSETGAMNPVLLLDEIDKVGGDYRGDPAAALLEVLDPAQNSTFRDHYLDMDLDLSDVFFIATANQLDTISGPLADRLEIISLEGYIDDEKLAIARHHLLPRLATRAGFTDDEVIITDDAIRSILRGHTREAGVRDLERKLGRLLQKVTSRVLDGETGIVIGPDEVTDLLGQPRHADEIAAREPAVGVVTGLAVTGAGGDILFVEATAMDGEPGLTLTGQLGDVMKESATIARSHVRANKAAFQLESGSAVDAAHVHIHVPAGATPKDGPSAGVTMTTAMVSLFSGRAVKPTVGMTGEVTLQGRVLPIGGVRQKVIAAHRAGLTDVILPARNGADLDDVPAEVRDDLTVHLVETVAEVLDIALV